MYTQNAQCKRRCLPHAAGISKAIATTVLAACIESGVFSELDQHMFDTSAVDNHVFSTGEMLFRELCDDTYASFE